MYGSIASQQHLDTVKNDNTDGEATIMRMIMVHQQYWSSSNNDAAADAIQSAYIILQSDSTSPFTPHHPPLQQMGCSAWVQSADEKSSCQNAS